MKNLTLLTGVMLAALLLAGCNVKQGARETGDAINTGVENIVEGVKQAPKAIGDAANNLDKKINE